MTQLMSGGGELPIRYAEVVARDGARFDCRHGHGICPPLSLLLRPGGLGGCALAFAAAGCLARTLRSVRSAQIIAMTEEDWEVIHEEDGHIHRSEMAHRRAETQPTTRTRSPSSSRWWDVTAANGATEFCARLARREQRRRAEWTTSAAPAPRRCSWPAGSAIAFDYRT